MSDGCQEHRKWMVLLGLKLQLKNNNHDPNERDNIEKQIMALEKELGID